MTAKKQSAIDALKSKLNALDSEDAVGLAAKAYYAYNAMNPDWDPKDHPRDPNTGEFVKGPVGYIFGKTKTAKFKGGASSKDALDIELHPGDAAFKTSAGNLVVSHPDGSYTLYQGYTGKKAKIPAGSTSHVAGKIQDGEWSPVAKNPGTSVPAKSLEEAAFKIENPSAAVAGAEKVEPATPLESAQAGQKSAWDIPKPSLKNGKSQFTAKQYSEYQAETLGLSMGPDADGKPIKSGDWVEFEGKPLKVFASPHGKHTGKDSNFVLTAYRWVSTKQQASNLAKEDFVSLADFGKMKVIPDPTGKPYIPIGQEAPESPAEAPKHGSLMQNVAIAAIPNTSAAHKKHVFNSLGVLLTDAPDGMESVGANFLTVKNAHGDPSALKGGDWLEIEGKPVQVFASPNEGNIAIAKWVSTKQKASGNTYDFPVSVLSNAIKISDPTGKDYTPLPKNEPAATPLKEALAPYAPEKKEEAPEVAPDGAKASRTIKDKITGEEDTYTYTKIDGAWWIDDMQIQVMSDSLIADLEAQALGKKGPDTLTPKQIDDQIKADEEKAAEAANSVPEEISTEDAIKAMVPGDTFYAIHHKTGKHTAYVKTTDGDFQAFTPTGKGQVGTEAKLISAVTGSQADNFSFFAYNPPENFEDLPGLSEFIAEQNMAPEKAPEEEPLLEWEEELLQGAEDYQQKVEEDPVSLPTMTTAYVEYSKYELKSNGKWYNEDYSELTPDEISVVETIHSEQKALSKQITEMEPGDQLKVTNKNGIETIYEVGEGDTFNNLTSGNPFPPGKAHFATAPLLAGSHNFKFEILKKADKPKTYDTPQSAPLGTVVVSDLGNQYVKHGDGEWTSVTTGATYLDAHMEPSYEKALSGVSGSITFPEEAESLTPVTFPGVGVGVGGGWGGPKGEVTLDLAPGDKAWYVQSADGSKGSVLVEKTNYTLVYADDVATHVKHLDEPTESSPFSNEWFFETVNGPNATPVAWESLSIDTPGEVDNSQADDASLGGGQQFVHPVSGVVIPLGPGDVVHKHKTTPNAYIVEKAGAELPIQFFNQHGKLYKPKASQKNLDTGYEPVDDWPGKQSGIATPGEKATPEYVQAAKPGDAVMVTGKNGGLYSNVWVKGSDGHWTSANGWHSTDDMAHKVEFGVHVYQAYPAGTLPDQTMLSGMTSPWGGEETSGESTPAPAAPKSSKSKKAALPTKYTFSGGKEIDLKPGEALVKMDLGSGTGVLHVKVKPKHGNYNEFLDLDTGEVKGSHEWFEQWTVGQAKKKDNAEVLAHYPITTVKADFSSYPKGEFSEKTYAGATSFVTKKRQEMKAVGIPTNYAGGIYHYSNFSKYNDKTWGDLTLDERMEIVAGYEDVAGSAVATLEEVSKWPADQIEKSEKADIGKARSGFALIHRIAILAREINNPDTSWDDKKFAEELSFVSQKAAKPGVALGSWLKTSYPLNDLSLALTEANNQRAFKKTLTNIPFDPYNGSTAEYDEYAKEQGFNYLSALSPEFQKIWILNTLGDPTITGHQKNMLDKAVNSAKTKIEIAILADSLTKESVKEVKASVSGSANAVFDKKGMKKSYKWDDGAVAGLTITHVENDVWTVNPNTPSGVPFEVGDMVVYSLLNGALNDGTTISESEDLAYPDVTAKQAVDNWLESMGYNSLNDLSDDALTTFVAKWGGGAVQTGSATYQRRWMMYHLAGDQIGKFYIEKHVYSSNGQEHPNAETHPGSPDSPAGKAAFTALAAHLMASPEGQKWLQEGDALPNSEALNKHLGLSGETVAPMTHDRFQSWKNWHPRSIIDEFIGQKPGAAPSKASAVKPADVSQEIWSVVSNMDDDTDISGLVDPSVLSLSSSALESTVTNSAFLAGHGLIPPLVGGLPDNVKRLLAWAASGGNYNTNEYQLWIIKAVAAKAKAGEYLTDSTPVWIGPGGAKYPISPGATVYKSTGTYLPTNSFLVSSPPNPNGQKSGYIFQNSDVSKAASYYVNNPSAYGLEPVFTMPSPLKWDDAVKENPSLVKQMWDESEKVEAGISSMQDNYMTGALLTSELKNNTILESDYPHLYAGATTLPENIKQAVFAALEKNNNGKPMLAVLEYKASKGHYASMGSAGLFDAGQPWVPFLSKGQFSESEISTHWSSVAKQAYAVHFGLTGHDKIAEHLNGLLNPAASAPPVGLPAWDDLSLTPTGKKLGGMHSKTHWVDQYGNEWMSKAFPSDPNSKARIEAETAGMRISRLFGFRAPVANSQKVPDAKYAYLQHLAPISGDLVGKSPNDLPLKQLQQTMEEHVLDWLISNHDSHHQNFKIDKQGNVFGIDKGQAFKHFPNDKLAVDYRPPENPEPVWYDRFYHDLQKGKISKEKADEVTKHVLRRAQQISKDKDEEFRTELAEALKSRTFWPDQFPTREKFIDALVERKHDVFEDFVEFYKGLYAKSPYDFTIDTENLIPPKLDDHTHIAVSADFAKDVFRSGIHGKALFFDSPDLEDSHIMFSKVTGPDGKTMLTGEAKIRKDGDTALSNWLKEQTIEKQTSHAASYEPMYTPPPVVNDYAELPLNTQWFGALVAGSKTVSSHNAAGDQQYNSGTLSNMDSVGDQINDAIEKMEAWEKKNPGKPFVGTMTSPYSTSVELKTMEQHNAWKGMLETYKGYYDKVIAHKGTSNKISPHFTAVQYTPSKAAMDELKKNMDAANKPVGTKYVSTKSDKVEYEKTQTGWTAKHKHGETSITDQQMQVLFDDNTVVAKDETEEEVEEVSTEVTVGTKVLKVIYRSAASKAGKLNDEGELTMQSGEISTFDTGNMYEIDFGTTVIEYRPWGTEHGVGKAQQGLLKFRKTDWNGDDPEPIDEILDVLRQMNLNLDPADEKSMELFYWKHLTATLKERAEGQKNSSSKYRKAVDALEKSYKDNPEMTTEEALEAHKKAWEQAIGKEKVEGANWTPKFGRNRMQALEGPDDNFTAGKPYWVRPDYTLADVQNLFPKNKVIASSLKNTGDALKIAKSGAGLSSDERYRILASGFTQGWSSGADIGNGSSTVIYTRLNMDYNWSSGYDQQVYYHPKVFLRTHNYSFEGDSYGNIEGKKNSPFDLKTAAKINSTGSYSSNETMIKNSVSVMDDIAVILFANESDRQAAIKYYEKRGIKEINGSPLSEVFTTSKSGIKNVYDKLWAKALQDEKEGKLWL